MRMWICGILGIIALGVCLFIGYMIGFPWERIAAENSARQYVMDTYGLTPTKVQAHFFFEQRAGVTVSTKEMDFDFEVYIARKNIRSIHNDEYLQSLIMSKITKAAKEQVRLLIEENCDLSAYTYLQLTRQTPHGISIEEVDASFEEVVKKLKDEYYFDISFVSDDNTVTPNFDNIFAIYQTLTDNWQPRHISFTYYRENGKNLVGIADILVEHQDFSEINSPADLTQRYKLR